MLAAEVLTIQSDKEATREDEEEEEAALSKVNKLSLRDAEGAKQLPRGRSIEVE